MAAPALERSTRTPGEGGGSLRETAPQGLAEALLLVRQRQIAPGAGEVRWTIGCSAAAGLDQVRVAIGQAKHQHAVMQQG